MELALQVNNRNVKITMIAAVLGLFGICLSILLLLFLILMASPD
jgi:hypothetical protein